MSWSQRKYLLVGLKNILLYPSGIYTEREAQELFFYWNIPGLFVLFVFMRLNSVGSCSLSNNETEMLTRNHPAYRTAIFPVSTMLCPKGTVLILKKKEKKRTKNPVKKIFGLPKGVSVEFRDV